MDGTPFLVSTMVNNECFAKTLLDSGCLSYGLVSERFATRNNLQRIDISPRGLTGFDAPSSDTVNQVAILSMDIDGHREEQAFCYIVPKIASYDMILGLPWMTMQDVRLNAPQSECMIMSSNTLVRNRARTPDLTIDCVAVSAAAFNMIARRRKTKDNTEVFSASMADIQKALAVRSKTDPRTKLPKHYHQFLTVLIRTKLKSYLPYEAQESTTLSKLRRRMGRNSVYPGAHCTICRERSYLYYVQHLQSCLTRDSSESATPQLQHPSSSYESQEEGFDFASITEG